jgi:hypothetical protein
MIYTTHGKSFQQHIHPILQRRIRIFLIMGGVMALIVLRDIAIGQIDVLLAVISVVLGGAVGYFSSRIFHLSWNKDGAQIIGKIDMIGWIVLGGYVLFEVVRNLLFETVFHTGFSTTAITFAFVAAALVGRVLGLRGRILKILKTEKVFGGN